MGGGLVCDGQDIIDKLNDVFGDPTKPQYNDAKSNNTFDKVKNGKDNYRALISAYVEAGVDVPARWGAYLRKLGKSAQGQQDIYDIAQTRHKPLKKGVVPMQTSKHGVTDMPHGGKHVKKHDGSGAADPSTIDSPFPLP
ncbi:MAG TPA: hypothetical protein VFI51_09110 [Bradyrhizobium sp.]|nr:hypothetical protein [Bradyrhizobium sp.]